MTTSDAQSSDHIDARSPFGDPSPTGGPALDWHQAKQNSGHERPSELPAGDAHLNVDRTFVFADLSGFTRYTRENGPHGAVKLLGEFREVARNVAAKRGVRVAKWLGDGVMLVSVDPTAAIAFGAHLIHHFGNTDLNVRVGIASGIALLFEGDDYIGEPVNLAAKLCSAAQPDEILSAVARADLPDWVKSEANVSVSIKGVGVIRDVQRLVPVI
ncbi:MAG: adenylate/guanylate cyclase domain-containing protein [Acidimicrobiales bacterium]